MKDQTLSDRTDWNVVCITKLLRICLETHFKTIDGRIYTQVQGTQIGKSISKPLANMFKPHIKFWKRCRENVYIIWNGVSDTLDCFFWQLNYKEPKIEFTIEREQNGILVFWTYQYKDAPTN